MLPKANIRYKLIVYTINLYLNIHLTLHLNVNSSYRTLSLILYSKTNLFPPSS